MDEQQNRSNISSIKNIYGISLDESLESWMTSITPWTLNVHYIRNGFELLAPWFRKDTMWLLWELMEAIPDTV